VEIPTTIEVTGTASSPVLRVGEEVTLTASFEGEFDSVLYDWDVVEGPGVVAAIGAAETSLTATGGDTIRIILTVRTEDENGPRIGDADVYVVSYEAPEDTRPQVVLDVADFGEITLALEVDAAPNTVANFMRYVDDGFYEGVLFHRVIPDFVIQAGGFIPDPENEDEVIPVDEELIRDPVESEAPNGLSNIRTTMAMALQGQNADSGTTQFFVNLDDNSNLDEGPPPFTVFAEVVDGMSVVDEVAQVETGNRSGLQNVPVENVIISEVRRVPGSEIEPE
jgi:cyclophilin family peptidyl-prolyl cis-trans isomerase